MGKVGQGMAHADVAPVIERGVDAVGQQDDEKMPVRVDPERYAGETIGPKLHGPKYCPADEYP